MKIPKYFYFRVRVINKGTGVEVEDASDVDVVEVVRCKDCKHNYHNMIPDGEAEHGCTKCIELPITADFYCSWGERENVDN